jgi:hypothetical protein
VFAIGGAVVLRRRRVTLFPAGIILAEVAVVAVAIFGQTRYRTPLDVVLVVLTAVAVDYLVQQRSRGPGKHAVRRRGTAPALSPDTQPSSAPQPSPSPQSSPKPQPSPQPAPAPETAPLTTGGDVFEIDHSSPMLGITAAPDVDIDRRK